MKIKFRNVKLNAANKERLGQINDIIEEYRRQRLVLTLRQLYYQLVSRDVIPNKQTEYSKLSTLLKEGRMGGIVDWDAIEDRLRRPSVPASWDTPTDAMESLIGQYRKPRMRGQKNYIEVWVEKDALSGVLGRVTRPYGINILVNRGYSSASAMYDSYERFKDALMNDQKVTILYLGDFDPSGMDMIRDIEDRISEFLQESSSLFQKYDRFPDEDCVPWEEEAQDYARTHKGFDPEETADVLWLAKRLWIRKFVKDNYTVIPIALTREQITRYNPPPNPAKTTDPRSKDFIAEHGNMSWEVDALKPEVLNQILESNILELIDVDLYNKILREEKADVNKLNKVKALL